MPPHDQRADRFVYDGYTVDPSRGEVRCSYSTGGHSFTERYVFGPDGDWGSPALAPAVRILFLLAGVSYYKTTAARVVDLGTTTTSAQERAFLQSYYVHGLGEFAYRNDLDLSELSVVGSDGDPAAAGYVGAPLRPLVPFGGGIDSIVTVEALRTGTPEVTLCIVHPPGDAFAAIEGAAAVTELPVVRVARQIDALVRRSDQLGFFNGHVPITAVITAASVVAAVLHHHDAVVLSNEWSASVPTLVVDGRPVNHQWSKGEDFERSFAAMVERSLGPHLSVFSYLRPRSELWVAQQFAGLTGYHRTFRSCNRAFHQDPAERLDHWCGVCDKCCFIDLMLAPFMSATDLAAVFGGAEPLHNHALEGRFAALLGLLPEAKPFECVGDIDECRAALLLAAARPDRQHTGLLHSLRALVPDGSGTAGTSLLAPLGPHYIPDRYAPSDLLVRAR